MRLLKLKYGTRGKVSLTRDLVNDVPAYAILSHTWGADEEEVTFDDLERGRGKDKVGWEKVRFCGEQARQHGLQYIWVDTCCINKANHAELSEAITSMCRWYRDAAKCYVYLSDVSAEKDESERGQRGWESAFRKSRWFTRGWTLQELLAPASVEFFSREGRHLGCKKTLEGLIHEITQIPVPALQGEPLSHFSVDERLRWTTGRNTKRAEDRAYCLLGIFDIFMPLMYGEGENAIWRLKEELSKRSRSSATPSAHMHWLVPRSRNPLFTGRDTILQQLDSTVCDAMQYPQTGKQCRIVISGMGGQGKSEISLQFAHGQRHRFWAIFWIDVSNRGQTERSFLDIADKLSLSAKSWEDARLGITNLKSPWLLVLDNADDPHRDYQHYFPDSPLGVVILTSRNDECQQYATVKPITLEGLSGEMARELLFKAARVPQDQHNVLDEDANIVADLLQAHPLALIQAGAYIGRGHCTLAEYPRLYEQQRQGLLQFRPTQAQSPYRDVYATFEVSAAMLTTSGTEATHDALQLLPLLAVCGRSRLPLSLFEAAWKGAKRVPLDMDDNAEADNVVLLTPWHVAHLPSLLVVTSDVWKPFRLIEAVSLLTSFSLISTDCHDGHLSVSMHPLIHAWAQDRQDYTGQHKSWLQMGSVMALSHGEGLWNVHRRQLQSHVEALTTWEVSTMFGEESPILVTRILVNCGWALYEMRADKTLFMLVTKIYLQLKLDRSKFERSWLGLYDLNARNLIRYGKPKEAVTLSQEIVKIEEQTLPEDHQNLLISQNVLAESYQADGQTKKAVLLLEKVVKIQEQSLSEDHPDRLSSQHNLAVSYRADGQIKKAVALLEKVVKIKEQTLPEDHPDRLVSQHNFSIYMWELGNHENAIEIMTEVIRVRRQVLDENHPHRVLSEGWLDYFHGQRSETRQNHFHEQIYHGRRQRFSRWVAKLVS